MKHFILTILLSMPSYAFQTELIDSKVQIQNNLGILNAKEFHLDEASFYDVLINDLNLSNKVLSFTFDQKKYSFSTPFESIKLLNVALSKGLKSTSELSINAPAMRYIDNDSENSGARLTVNCQLSPYLFLEKDYLQIIEGCSQYGRLSLLNFTSIENLKRSQSFLHRLFGNTNSRGKSTVTIKNLTIEINSNEFQLKAKISSGLTVNLTIEGQVRLENPSSLRLTILKAKASFVDIRERIFSEIKESDQIRVSYPSIYFSIDQ